jgi:hypothetical protein
MEVGVGIPWPMVLGNLATPNSTQSAALRFRKISKYPRASQFAIRRLRN